MSVILVCMDDQGQRLAEVSLSSSTVSIGRSSKNQLCIKDELLSSLHGTFSRDAMGRIVYCDHSSKNGSFLNGSQVTSCFLKIRDYLKLGNIFVVIDDLHLTASERNTVGHQRTRRQPDLSLLKDVKKS